MCGAGIHHLTLRSPLNKGRDGNAYGVIDVHADRLELRGPSLEDLLPSHKVSQSVSQSVQVGKQVSKYVCLSH